MFLLKRMRLREQRRQPLKKFTQKAPQPPALKPPSTARTAGRSDRAERRFRRQPFILLSFSSSKKPQKRRKRSHTNVSNTLVTRPSTPPAQTPQRSFRGTAAGTHLPSPTGSHTAAHRAKQGRFGWGRYYYPRSVLRGSETLRGRVSERRTLPLLGLGRGCSQRTQRAFGTAMRLCASLSRGVAAPLGCVIPWLFPSPHRWVSRFSLVTAIERREHICRFHTLVCSMRLATC